MQEAKIYQSYVNELIEKAADDLQHYHCSVCYGKVPVGGNIFTFCGVQGCVAGNDKNHCPICTLILQSRLWPCGHGGGNDRI